MLAGPMREMLETLGLKDAPPEVVAELFADDAVLEALWQLDIDREVEKFDKFHQLFPPMADCPLMSPEGKFYRLVGESRYYAREHYAKHLEFFEKGKTFRARCFMAANRVGKTFSAGAFETACHLTGDYPKWWPGHQFRSPIRAWACGKTNETTRDIVQTTLLGDVAYNGARKVVDGSGVIPRARIGMDPGSLTWKQGVADLVDTVRIRHKSGGWSKLGLKSYQQGRGSFEGTAQHFVWDDEEPPMDVYGEQIIRTATTNGRLILTFTPLQGISDVVQQFLPSNDFEV